MVGGASLSDGAALISALAAVIGFGVVLYQLRQIERSARVSAMSSLYAQGGQLRENVARYQDLRPFLFEGAEIPPEHAELNRAKTLAEMQLNYFEQLSIYSRLLPSSERNGWLAWVKKALARSPLAVEILHKDIEGYSPTLCQLSPRSEAR